MTARKTHLSRARADVVFRRLVEHGSDGLEGLVEDLVWPGSGLTRAQVERALEDLARAGRVELTGKRGFVGIEVLIDAEAEAILAELEACRADMRAAA